MSQPPEPHRPPRLIDLNHVVGYRVRVGSEWIALHPEDVEIVMDTP